MNQFIIVCLTTVFVILINSGNGAEEKTCKAILSDLTKRQMSGIAACSKSMTFKNGKDKAAKMNCVIKCVMMNEGMLGKDGTMTTASVDVLVEKEFPASMWERVKPMFNTCVTSAGGGLDPSPADEFCKTYDALIKCLMGAVGNLCK